MSGHYPPPSARMRNFQRVPRVGTDSVTPVVPATPEVSGEEVVAILTDPRFTPEMAKAVIEQAVAEHLFDADTLVAMETPVPSRTQLEDIAGSCLKTIRTATPDLTDDEQEDRAVAMMHALLDKPPAVEVQAVPEGGLELIEEAQAQDEIATPPESAAPETTPAEEPEKPEWHAAMKKADLMAVAQKRGLAVEEDWTKAKIIDALTSDDNA